MNWAAAVTGLFLAMLCLSACSAPATSTVDTERERDMAEASAAGAAGATPSVTPVEEATQYGASFSFVDSQGYSVTGQFTLAPGRPIKDVTQDVPGEATAAFPIKASGEITNTTDQRDLTLFGPSNPKLHLVYGAGSPVCALPPARVLPNGSCMHNDGPAVQFVTTDIPAGGSVAGEQLFATFRFSNIPETEYDSIATALENPQDSSWWLVRKS